MTTDIQEMGEEELAYNAEDAMLLYIGLTKPLLAVLAETPCRLSPSEKQDVQAAFDALKLRSLYRAELKDRHSSVA